jgi:hypothetical protein
MRKTRRTGFSDLPATPQNAQEIARILVQQIIESASEVTRKSHNLAEAPAAIAVNGIRACDGCADCG